MKNKFTEKPKKLFWILSYKSLIIAILFVLLTSAAIFTVTYSTLQHTLRSNVVYQALSNYKAQSLFYFMHTENHHFSHAFEEDFSASSLFCRPAAGDEYSRGRYKKSIWIRTARLFYF